MPKESGGPGPNRRVYGALCREAPTGWRARMPRWRPKIWLGMAIANRLHEWRWIINHRILRRPDRWPKGTFVVPREPPQDAVN